MSVKKITQTVYECICELPRCKGKGKPWPAEKIPLRCRWCGSYRWNGRDGRAGAPLTAFGKTQTLTAWAAETGIPLSTLYQRIYRSRWPLEKALTTPRAVDLPVGTPALTTPANKDHSSGTPALTTPANKDHSSGTPALTTPANKDHSSGTPALLRDPKAYQPSAGKPLIASQNSVQGSVVRDQATANPREAPPPVRQGPGHALGCKCTVCQMAKGKIVLPKPQKVRNIE